MMTHDRKYGTLLQRGLEEQRAVEDRRAGYLYMQDA